MLQLFPGEIISGMSPRKLTVVHMLMYINTSKVKLKWLPPSKAKPKRYRVSWNQIGEKEQDGGFTSLHEYEITYPFYRGLSYRFKVCSSLSMTFTMKDCAYTHMNWPEVRPSKPPYMKIKTCQ